MTKTKKVPPIMSCCCCRPSIKPHRLPSSLLYLPVIALQGSLSIHLTWRTHLPYWKTSVPCVSSILIKKMPIRIQAVKRVTRVRAPRVRKVPPFVSIRRIIWYQTGCCFQLLSRGVSLDSPASQRPNCKNRPAGFCF